MTRSRPLYHHPKPFFRASRSLWYVQLRGKQINLGPDREQALERYYKLMQQATDSSAAAVAPSSHVTVIVDQFLEWCQQHRSADTYAWYLDRLQRFVSRYPQLQVDELKNWHVQQWMDSYPGLSSGSKRNLCRAIQRTLRWAEQQGLVERSPIAHLQKPRAGRRKTVIDEAEYERILAHAPNEAFRDLVRFAWHSGARAAECLAIEQRHLDLAQERIVFPVDEEKMERIPRIIYLSQAALDVVRRRAEYCRSFIFTNSNGKAWTTDAVNCAFSQVRIRMGKQVLKDQQLSVSDEEIKLLLPKLQPKRKSKGQELLKTMAELRAEAKRKLTRRLAMQHAPQHCLTEFRHSWCHHALRRGLDSLTVSVLMGHSDPTMVGRIYSHLSYAPDYLRQQAQRANG